MTPAPFHPSTALRVIGIITARGGSKGIPRKNIQPLLGKPLLAYTAEAALAATRLTRLVLSTEDAEIARLGVQLGLEVPFLRPEHLAQDDSRTIPVLQDVIRRLAAAGQTYDAVMTLQPTAPLRTAHDIDGSIALLQTTGADSVISLVDVGGHHPARMKLVDEAGRVFDPPFAEAVEGQPRQQLPRLFIKEGSIYLTRTKVLMHDGSLQGADCRAWLIPPDRACNIDTPSDLFIAEQMLKRGQARGSGLLVRHDELPCVRSQECQN
jgi:CMP-N-acetylneuraminic acid synthetase